MPEVKILDEHSISRIAAGEVILNPSMAVKELVENALDAGATRVEVEIEEAFVDTLALPAGTGLRFGRFYSDIGYLNRVHSHAWDFRDQPLVYRAMLGSQYTDDGVQFSGVLVPLG